jgi:hypothetical protein
MKAEQPIHPDELRRLMMTTFVQMEGDRLANDDYRDELPDVCMDCGDTAGPFHVVTSSRVEGDEFVVTMEGKRCVPCERRAAGIVMN